ncbi:2-oxoacid:acceptor oxidoreductase subunit alpha [Mucisphaera calidilacus]|uniref:2-oxoglutarate oxidoreductase subunit KorA n=1 Tax=Mucisphaera calidilacus TaxID=2527982 RepID=A0A518BYN7_9BACT|nr:2-oxoacid:acceptor oxidoreductase subunit alpha [Mucisphaera calidilacus]QDU72089.1 2-oxoglutarate oxidoreductase subunit KorA [Mucisphaera calidilacus]
MSSGDGVSVAQKPAKRLTSAVIRFAGDSGDGMQMAGTQFTDTSALFGNDVATLPDFPAEIRAPAGTVAGVSGFQINFASEDIHTPGDRVNALIAMNPAALKAHIVDVEPGGLVIVNETEFTKVNLKKAKYAEGYNPLDDEVLNSSYQLLRVPISRLNSEALAETGLGAKDAGRCRNMYALGIVYWLYGRPLETTVTFIENYFTKKKKRPEVAEANIKALKAGYYFGETAEIFSTRYAIDKAEIAPGVYRKVTGNDALAMGLIAASELSGKDLVYCSYPITPASTILHALSAQKQFGVKTFQAEDEIAACCAAIGASYAGQIGVTGTSGPGLALKGEAMGLAVITELPLIVVNVQRGGPSTGLPTKTEQADLLQAMYGRNSDSPVVVLAPSSPGDCFEIGIEAARIAMQHMTPVVILTDGYLANGAEPWAIPDVEKLEPIELPEAGDASSFEPYARDEKGVRPWASPGMAGFEHRIGGLEKEHVTGNVSYDPENHQLMTLLRQQKIDKVAEQVPAIEPYGDADAELLVLGWGGPCGSIYTAVERARERGLKVAGAHLRYLNPMPMNLGEVLKRFPRVLIPEINMGQLRSMLRAKFLVDARGLNKVQGRPFLVEEISMAIDRMLDGTWGDAEALMPRNGELVLPRPWTN